MRASAFGLSGLMAVLFAGSAAAEVERGENLLVNGTFEADQVEVPPYWGAFPRARFKAFSSGGPKGTPFVRLVEGKGDASYRQGWLYLSTNGHYRLTAKVRTNGFVAKSKGIGIIDDNWNRSDLCHDIPSDTHGAWKEVRYELKPMKSKGGYRFVIYAHDSKGAFDIADVKFEAVDAAALRETQPSSAAAMTSRPWLVPLAPLLWKIPSDDRRIVFAFFGKPANGGEDSDYDVVVRTDGGESAAPLDRRHTFVTLPPNATGGVFRAMLRHRASGAVVCEREHSYRVGGPRVAATAGRRLNNLCTEILSAEADAEGRFRGTFTLAQDGWVYVRTDGGTATLDGRPVIAADTPRTETFRFLERGRHGLDVAGPAKGRVVVRRIAEIFNYCPGVSSQVTGNGRYDWAFQKKHVLRAVTTENGGGVPGGALADFKASGRRWIANLGTSHAKEEEVRERLETCEGLRDDRFDGVSCDEQFVSYSNDIIAYEKALHGFDLRHAPEKLIYTWAAGKPEGYPHESAFLSTCINASRGNGQLLIEAYCRTRATEQEAKDYLALYVGGSLNRYRKFNPIAPASIGVILGNFNQLPILSLWHHPEVDFKYFLDLQLNYLANDPAASGIGTVGYWGSYYGDEETHRWSFELMRHYVVEGRTEMLSAKYGFAYNPGLLADGDFREGLSRWQVFGDVAADTFASFASCSQNRWGGNDGVGDTFAALKRTAGPAASLRQRVSGLVPGRKYALQAMTFDVDDVKAKRVAPRKIALNVKLGPGVQLDEARSFDWVDTRAKGRYAKNDGVARVNLVRRVFTATAPETVIAFDNEAAKPGETLGVNGISLCPYFDEN